MECSWSCSCGLGIPGMLETIHGDVFHNVPFLLVSPFFEAIPHFVTRLCLPSTTSHHARESQSSLAPFLWSFHLRLPSPNSTWPLIIDLRTLYPHLTYSINRTSPPSLGLSSGVTAAVGFLDNKMCSYYTPFWWDGKDAFSFHSLFFYFTFPA